MRTDIVPTSPHAGNFTLRFGAWSLGLFGVLRLASVETYVVLPVTRLQGQLAARLSGVSVLPVDVTLACSGTDVLALCLGAILAYPSRWRLRLAGAGAGAALILCLNTLRIATLAGVADSPSWFNLLHFYVWPALLTLAVAAYVFTWMRWVDRRRRAADESVGVANAVINRDPPRRAVSIVDGRARSFVDGRFVLLTAAFLVIFTASSPLYLESAGVLGVAALIARTAAFILEALGIHASASANVLSTTRGGFLVTQECISTPLIPIYLAAVCAYAHSWRSRTLGLLAAAPVFVGLGVARLLIVALPATLVGSPIFLVHAFYQLLLAAVVVVIAAVWCHGTGATARRRALLGLAVGGLFVYLFGTSYARALASAFDGRTPLEDSQGAIALLPAFQIGMYVALSLAALRAFNWRPFATALAVLVLSQIAFLAALHVAARDLGFAPHVRDIRAWAVAAPLLAFIVTALHQKLSRASFESPSGPHSLWRWLASGRSSRPAESSSGGN
ncbi:MAG: archaeosortase/exosortase family protein [Vicinamibacterales bacterium]